MLTPDNTDQQARLWTARRSQITFTLKDDKLKSLNATCYKIEIAAGHAQSQSFIVSPQRAFIGPLISMALHHGPWPGFVATVCNHGKYTSRVQPSRGEGLPGSARRRTLSAVACASGWSGAGAPGQRPPRPVELPRSTCL